MRRQFIKTLGTLAAACGIAPPAPAASARTAKTDKVANSPEASKSSKPDRFSPVKPRHVICILGEWLSLEPAAKIIDAFGKGFTLDREYSMTEADERMEKAFRISMDRVSPSFTDSDWQSIERHNTVVYVLSPQIETDKAMAISSDALDLVGRLIKGGATAVKSESAGNAHGLARWAELASRRALREAWVRRPIGDDDIIYSCGMQLLGLPDVECPGLSDREAVKWIDAIADAALAGRSVGPSFTLGGGKAKKLKRFPCERYADDDFFFNPYGYYRVTT